MKLLLRFTDCSLIVQSLKLVQIYLSIVLSDFQDAESPLRPRAKAYIRVRQDLLVSPTVDRRVWELTR